MFEPTSKIDSIISFREPETGTSPRGQKRKPQPKPVASPASLPEPAEPHDDADEHNLDTLA
jgi:hypothetical protein